MTNSTKTLEDFEIYQIAMSIGEDVWKIVSEWDNFPKIHWVINWSEVQIQSPQILQKVMDGFISKIGDNSHIIVAALF